MKTLPATNTKSNAKKLLAAASLGLSTLMMSNLVAADVWYANQGRVSNYFCDDATNVCVFQMASNTVNNHADCLADGYTMDMDNAAAKGNFAIIMNAYTTNESISILVNDSECSNSGRTKVRSVRIGTY